MNVCNLARNDHSLAACREDIKEYRCGILTGRLREFFNSTSSTSTIPWQNPKCMKNSWTGGYKSHTRYERLIGINSIF
jgi:hypothetical protein